MVLVLLNVDYSYVNRYNSFFYIATNILLILVLVLGTEMRGSQGWIVIGGFNVQVAEFAKIMIILCFADFLSKRQGVLHTFRDMLPCFIYIGLPFLLVMVQPDLGSALAFIAITLGMMFVAGANPKILLGIVFGGLVLAVLIIFATSSSGCGCP